ncbi:iron-containing alcohol dehydrogenase [Paludibacterium purpuratum]|uniref:NADP-dependent alcohol dehydrogenase n=1 Tax=Paludibacterium purpuratum TaxID=1144873 RepID=A0A4R7BDN1_9NEIS|nr:iron-containing alcohol dehydrogenase [Paludibacterium purpuratum]TDR82292.1 NADP-dependent alcohol dehydrogenase [Paludibacterium purpuratum]
MLNFTYYNPTRIVFGRDTIGQLSSLVPADARVLVLYGGASAEKTGTLAEVRSALSRHTFMEFGGIEPNPHVETLLQAVNKVREHRLDFLLAVGGGSVIDGGKFIAAAACHDGDALEILRTRGAAVTQALPLGAVLTLAATGSEMNCSGVVTHVASQSKLPFRHPLLFPRFSILDPQKTYTVPERQVANGVVDAFVHVAEQYLTVADAALAQERFAEGLMQSLIELGPQVQDKPRDYDVRANLMWVATMALNGVVGAGVTHDWSTHMIGHELTVLYGIDHARTLALVLPASLMLRRAGKRAKLLQYAERVWQLREGDEEARIEQAIELTRDFFERMGLPTRLSAYGLGDEAIDAVVAQLQAHGMTQLGERGEVVPALVRQILQAAR